MHAEPAVAGTALRLLQRPAGPSTGPQPLWLTLPWPGGSHPLLEPRIGTELCPQELTPGPRHWGRWGVIGQGVSMLPHWAGFRV